MGKSDNSASGIGFTGFLQLMFILLKLCGIIEWSWWWVLSPTWMGILFVVIIVIIIALLS